MCSGTYQFQYLAVPTFTNLQMADAIIAGKPKLVRALLLAGCDITRRDKTTGESFLHIAVAKGSE